MIPTYFSTLLPNMGPNLYPIYTTTTTNSKQNETKSVISNSKKRLIQAIVDIIGMIVCFVAFGIVYAKMKPKIRYYTCDMSDVSFPYKKNTIPFWAVGIYGVIGPILTILLVEPLNAKLYPFQNNYKETIKSRLRGLGISIFHSISLFVFGISIVLLLTEIGKRWIGRLRPHFLDVCKPNLNSLNCITNAQTGSVYNSIYTGGSFCNADSNDVEEARLSFPSGHSSFSAYTMLFLIIYLEARLFLLKFRYLKALIQLSAFIAVFVTSISRISDYHHRGSDVIGGAILGSSVALFITFVLGRVLWYIDREESYYDFDMKPSNA